MPTTMSELRQLYVRAFEETDEDAGRQILDALKHRFGWTVGLLTRDDVLKHWDQASDQPWSEEVFDAIRQTKGFEMIEIEMIGAAIDLVQDAIQEVLDQTDTQWEDEDEPKEEEDA